MAFNDQNNGKSPWDPKQQPPDLDQIVEEWQKKFNTLFGGSSNGSSQKKGPPVIATNSFRSIFMDAYRPLSDR